MHADLERLVQLCRTPLTKLSAYDVGDQRVSRGRRYRVKLTQPLKFCEPSAVLEPAIGSSVTGSAPMTLWLKRFEHDATEISAESYHRPSVPDRNQRP